MHTTIARIAAAIGEPARANMLCALLDGRARTSTELALVANVTPATASAHLTRLREQGLVRQVAQGKHRFYSLTGRDVAQVLERLNVLAGATGQTFVPTAPVALRAARSCYDHLAGAFGVALHDAFVARHWLTRVRGSDDAYDLTAGGDAGLRALGIDVDGARGARRRFAYACLDWSERRPHLGGALAAAVLETALAKRWVARVRDSRALRVTAAGERVQGAMADVEPSKAKRALR